jgi:aminoglycoside phosphotransferase (APT) family kinase protein
MYRWLVPAANMPAAEVEISEQLVRTLLLEQHPDLADLDIRLLTNGWDNALFRLGPELLVRLPRRQMAARLVVNEAAWLPALESSLPIPVPAPVRLGGPSDSYPWNWAVVPWFEGEAVGMAAFADPARAATQLGEFLAALHQPAPPDAPANPYRGGPLSGRSEVTVERIDALGDEGDLEREIDLGAVRSAWHAAAARPAWEGKAMWLHGDLHPLNMIQSAGELAAIIDFGDITSGDPATDLLAAWALFDEPHREIFRSAADSSARPIDDDMWERGRGWAIYHGLAILSSGADAPVMTAVGLRALRAAA